MPNLFGLDIAKIVSDSIVGAGGLRIGLYFSEESSVLNADDLTAPQHLNVQTYQCQCYATQMSAYEQERSAVESTGTVSILADTLAVKPKVGDKVTIDDTTYELTELMSVDPAGALYKFGSKAGQEPIVIPPPAVTGRAFSAAFSEAFG